MPEQIQTEQKFDIRTHRFDARGRLKSRNFYRMHVDKGTNLFERPVNSGNLFYENNEPAGRVEFTKNEKGAIIGKKFDLHAPHKAFVAPLTGAEAMHYENEQLKADNARLAAELEAINAERAAKAAAGTKTADKAPSALAAATEAKAEPAKPEPAKKPAASKDDLL